MYFTLDVISRLGKLTASRMADATARTKSGWASSRADYITELAIERISGLPTPSYTNANMDWGIKTEAEARTVYEFVNNVDVVDVGFVPHPRIPMLGASPDGAIGSDGLLEIKCPKTTTHMQSFRGRFDNKYDKQMQTQMACTGRQWVDFMSYDPRVPLEYRVVIRRVHRDDRMIERLEKEAEEFLAEVAAEHTELVALAESRSVDALRKALEASVAKETAA